MEANQLKYSQGRIAERGGCKGVSLRLAGGKRGKRTAENKESQARREAAESTSIKI